MNINDIFPQIMKTREIRAFLFYEIKMGIVFQMYECNKSLSI